MRYSIIPIRAVEDPQLQRAALRVLLSLGAYTDRDGYCYPSQSTLARRLRVSRQAVNRQIKVLVRLGYLQVTRRKSVGGGETSCLYRIYFEDPSLIVGAERDLAGEKNEFEPRSKRKVDYGILLRAPEVEVVAGSSEGSLCPAGIQQTTNCLDNGSHKSEQPAHDFPTPGAALVDAPGATPHVARDAISYISPSASSDVAQTTQLTPHIPKKKNGVISSPNRKAEVTTIPSSPPSNQLLEPAFHSQKGRIVTSHPSILGENLSGIPGYFPEATPLVKNAIPLTPLEAHAHPDLRVYIALTAFTPAASDYQTIIQVLRLLRSRFPSDQSLTDYLAPFWQKWCESRRRNGSRYSRANFAWLTEWACNDHIPATFPDPEDAMISQDPGVYQHAMEPKPEPAS